MAAYCIRLSLVQARYLPVCRWLTQHRPELIASSVFIDPVCFSLHVPGVSRSFLYNRFVPHLRARDHYHQHFSWSRTLLWPSDLTAPTTIVLSEHDQFVPVKAVHDSFEADTRSGVDRPQVLTMPVGHGHFLTNAAMATRVVDAVRVTQDRARQLPLVLDTRV